ncbi:hypothetical protein BY996DRAFT_6565121 [Phakopsora pachyrhizi]|nr:hypothetical protein BY996DRAFT_6565121 [Phakopsora pachyrhizi]
MSISTSTTLTHRILLNNNNYHVWSTLMESEFDNIGCVEITTESGVDISTEIEKKGYHLIVRYLSEEVLGYLANVIKTEDKGKGSIAWNLLKNKFAGNTTGLNMESECLSLLILQKSPRNYDSLVRIISQMEPIPHEEEVLKILEKDQLQFNNKDKNVEAIYVKKPYKKKFEKFNKFNKEKRIKCHNCNKLGHLAKDFTTALNFFYLDSWTICSSSSTGIITNEITLGLKSKKLFDVGLLVPDHDYEGRLGYWTVALTESRGVGREVHLVGINIELEKVVVFQIS